jgi:phospholipid N-methyltransferase
LRFLSEFFRSPNVTGAVTPSSSALARTIVEWIDWGRVETVMELGPGTGAFTRAILDQKPASCRFLALEVNPEMCRILHDQYPELEVCEGSVAHLARHCESSCVEEVDAVVSGLPWAVFTPEQQDEYLGALMCVLRRGGQFTTFAYVHGAVLPAGRRFRLALGRFFGEVTTTGVVWRNLPPAFVYRCRR